MEYLQANRWKPQQVQDFMPTPMTLASEMQWTGVDPLTGKPVAVVADMEEKRMQKALIRWGDPANRPLVEKALRLTGRLKAGERMPGTRVAGDGARPPWARRGMGKGRKPRG